MNCCFSLKHREQVTVPPGETVAYACEVHVRGPGPFKALMVVHLQEDGFRDLTLRVRGVAVAAGGSADEKTPPR